MADKMEYENLPPGHMATFVEGELGFLPFFPPGRRPHGPEAGKAENQTKSLPRAMLALWNFSCFIPQGPALLGPLNQGIFNWG